MANQVPRGVHLVGSVPLADEAEVFRMASSILGERLRRIPDGETGVRRNWIGWQYPVFAGVPAFELVPSETGLGIYPPHPRFRLRDDATAGDVSFGRLGYADSALASYETFVRLKEAGEIPVATRFLVSLPTPLAPVASLVAPESRAVVEPIYEAQLLGELDEICTAIPSDQLAVQWDVAVEFGILEGASPADFQGVRAGIVERLVRLGGRVPEGVELGYHLCYGDAGHRHFVEPADTRLMVEIANAVAAGVIRPLEWLHLPVPRDRTDDAYYAPLRDLRLHPESELYLGLVHYTDGIEGTRRRIAAAQRAVPQFGIATECGLGRRPPETIPDLLRIHAAVAEPLPRDKSLVPNDNAADRSLIDIERQQARMLERFHVPTADEVRIDAEALRGTVKSIFEALAVPPESAAAGADVLVATDLRGVETHGVSNMLRWYVEGYRMRTLNPTPQWKVVRETPSTATLDGDRGLGIMLGAAAMQLAVAKAREVGVGIVTLANTGHIGAVGHYAMLAAQQDMVGVCITCGGTLVVPTFGAASRLGTDPISVAAPARNLPPLLFDAATSAIAGNKLNLALRVGANVLPGWLSEPDGTPVMDERPVPDRGNYHLLPLGSTREVGSHKGYGFALMAEVLAALLSGTAPSMVNAEEDLVVRFKNYFAAYNIAAFTDLDWFKDTMDQMLQTLLDTPPAPGHARVIYPGWSEHVEEQERLERGIPLHREVIDWFDRTTDELGLARLGRMYG